MYEIVVGRDEEDRKRFGLEGVFLLGKHYVTMGQTTSLANEVFMDATRCHVVFVCGKRGSGKCVAGDTLVSLDDGRLIPIRELENDSSGIIAIDGNLKAVKAQKSSFYKRTVNELLEITMRSGKTIKLTPEHPLLSIYGWAKATAFSVGDRLATPRLIPNFGNKMLPESQIKLLAYLIAEGHLAQGVLFSNTDPALVKDFSEAAKEFDENLEMVKLKEGDYRLYSRFFKSRITDKSEIRRNHLGQFTPETVLSRAKTPIREFLEHHELHKKLSADKKIPAEVMPLQKPLLSLFLRVLFSCDGSIYYKKSGDGGCWQISYSTISSGMVTQLHHILLRFGILSRLRKKKTKCNGKLFDSSELVISGENVLTFIEEIGFFGKKQEKQKRALNEIFIIKKNPNVDTIPKGIWNLFKPESWANLGRELNYAHPKAMRERVHYCPSRQTLLQIAVVEQNEFLHTLVTSDIFWDEIIAIKKMSGNFEVFDLSVPELHNFVANDIIVHNSYTMGAMAEGIMAMPSSINSNISIIMLDTMGIYWTMKYENKQDPDLLKQWSLKSIPLNLKIYTPAGFYEEFKEKGIPTDAPFSIKLSDMTPADWCMTFNLNSIEPVGILISRVISTLNQQERYSMQDIIDSVKNDQRAEPQAKSAAENLFMAAQSWGLFSERGTQFSELAVGGQITVLDVSCYAAQHSSTSIRALVIGLVSQKLFDERMSVRRYEEYESVKAAVSYLRDKGMTKQKFPLVWIMVDEAHEFLPKSGETSATKPLMTLLREGRQPGISLVLASQQPGQIHTDVMTQADVVIAHRITSKVDIDALGTLMQTYMREGLDKALNALPDVKGAALLFDDTNEKLYPIRVRPRTTWHGGSSPVAIKEEKKLFND
ncbi:MAG: LAGLIDADG family homing endonuclease [Candidatus Woesearchaeota archaeon]